MPLSTMFRYTKSYHNQAWRHYSLCRCIYSPKSDVSSHMMRRFVTWGPRVALSNIEEKYQCNVIVQKDNLKVVTKRLDSNHSKLSSGEFLLGGQPSQSGGVRANLGTREYRSDLSVEEIFKDLQRLCIAAVMNKPSSVSDLRDFVAYLETRSDDISLSAKQVVEFSSCASHLFLPPSCGQASFPLPLSADSVALRSTVASSLYSFLGDRVRHGSSAVQGGGGLNQWSFAEVADLMFHLRAVPAGCSGSALKLIREVLKVRSSATRSTDCDGPAAAEEREAISLRSISRAAMGLHLMPPHHPTTQKCYELAAEHLSRYCELPKATATLSKTLEATHTREALSLFLALNHAGVSGSGAKNNGQKSYMIALTKFLSSARYLSLPVTREGVYGGMLANMRSVACTSAEEVNLLQGLHRAVCRAQLSSPEVEVPSLRASCRALEGLQRMSSANATVRSILGLIGESIRASKSSLSADMLTSVLHGLQNKNSFSCATVHHLLEAVCLKLTGNPRSRTLLSDEFVLAYCDGGSSFGDPIRGSGSGRPSDSSSTMLLRPSSLDAIVKALPYLNAEREEARQLLAVLAPQVQAMLAHFVQRNSGFQDDVYSNNFTIRGKKGVNTEAAAMGTSSVVDSARNCTAMLSLLYQGMGGCLNLSSRSPEAIAILEAFGSGIRNLRDLIDSLRSHSRAAALQQLSTCEGDDSPTIMRDVQLMTAVKPGTVLRAFDGLSGMKGNHSVVNQVLIVLTEALDDAVAAAEQNDKAAAPSRADIYRVMWAVRGLYPDDETNSPVINGLVKSLLGAIRTTGADSAQPTLLWQNTLWQTVYSLQNLSADSPHVRQLLTFLTADLERSVAFAHDNRAQSATKQKGTPIQDMMFGLRNLNSSWVEVRNLLPAVSAVVENSAEVWDTEFMGSTLRSLQFMSSEHKEVVEFVRVLAGKVQMASGNLPMHSLNKIVDSLQGLHSEQPEVRALLAALVAKASPLPEHGSGSSAGWRGMTSVSFVGFQHMSSEYPEVRGLLGVFSAALEATTRNVNSKTKGVTAKEINMVIGSLHGMRGLKSDHAEVRATVRALTAYLTKCDRVTPKKRAEVGGHLACPYMGFVASAVYGLQNMSSAHAEVQDLIALLAQQAKLCTTAAHKKGVGTVRRLTPREAGMALTGLQGMSSDIDIVRSLVKSLLPHIHFVQNNTGSSKSPRVTTLLKDGISPVNNNLAWYVESCIGLQQMTADSDEVKQLIRAVTKNIRESEGNLTTTAIAKAVIGIQNLREHNPSAPPYQSSSSSSSSPPPPASPSSTSGSREVNDLIAVICEKIKLSPLYHKGAEYRNEDGAINGDFISAVFHGLKHRDSEVREVRQLMTVLLELLKRCPVGLTEEVKSPDRAGRVAGGGVADSRYKNTGMTSFQLSSCVSCLSSCREDRETLDLLEALRPHLQHIKDRSVKKALGSITHHFSQSDRFRSRSLPGEETASDQDTPHVHPEEIFTGRHFANVLFGLRRFDVAGVSRDMRAAQVTNDLCEILSEMVHANCNTTLSERVVRGVSFSIRDSNNSIWSGEDVCGAMSGLSYCHVEQGELHDYEQFTDVIHDEVDEDGHNNNLLDVFSGSGDSDVFSLNPFIYDLVNVLGESLYNMKLSTRRNNTDGSDLRDEEVNGGSGGVRELSRSDDGAQLSRVISVPHLARAASGLRHLSAYHDGVERAMQALVERLQDSYFHHYFPCRDAAEAHNLMLRARTSADSLDQYLRENNGNFPSLVSELSAHVAPPAPLCRAADLCRLLSSVGRMSVRYSAVGNLYKEVGKIIHDPHMALLMASNPSTGKYQPAVGQLSFEEIASVFNMLRFNQCSSEVRLVVTALTAQLVELSGAHKQSGESTRLRGHDLGVLMEGMSSMTSSVDEVRAFLKVLRRHLQQSELVELQAGDVSRCLASMCQMDSQHGEVRAMLTFFCDHIDAADEGGVGKEFKFSVDEMYGALEGLSGMCVGEAHHMRDRAVVHRLIDIIRRKSS